MKILSTRTVLGDLTEMWSLSLIVFFLSHVLYISSNSYRFLFSFSIAWNFVINAARRVLFQLSGIFANVQLDMLKVFGLVNYLNTL